MRFDSTRFLMKLLSIFIRQKNIFIPLISSLLSFIQRRYNIIKDEKTTRFPSLL